MANAPAPFVPKFSNQFRTVVYVVGAFVATASFVVAGAAATLMADPTAVVTIAALTGSGFGSLAANFGVAYRPTVKQ